MTGCGPSRGRGESGEEAREADCGDVPIRSVSGRRLRHRSRSTDRTATRSAAAQGIMEAQPARAHRWRSAAGGAAPPFEASRTLEGQRYGESLGRPAAVAPPGMSNLRWPLLTH